MKLLSVGLPGKERPVVMVSDGIILDLGDVLPQCPKSLRDILAQNLLPVIAEVMQQDNNANNTSAITGVRIGAPISEPSKIFGIGLNYRDHAEEQNKPVPDKPLVFAKAPSCVIGLHDQVLLPDPVFENFVDAEAELAVVIGREAYQITEQAADDYIAGYTIMNDVSGRHTQKTDGQWTRAKSFNTFGPMGPCLVTKDEMPDPHGLAIRCSINDEIWQDSNTANLIFNIPYLVSYLSQTMTLYPGDIISTGTPGGVGFGRKPPVRLKAGDRIKIEIEGLGVLENEVA